MNLAREIALTLIEKNDIRGLDNNEINNSSLRLARSEEMSQIMLSMQKNVGSNGDLTRVQSINDFLKDNGEHFISESIEKQFKDHFQPSVNAPKPKHKSRQNSKNFEMGPM